MIEIQEMIDRETRAWNEKNVELLLTVFHSDMVWPWPPTSKDHDPETWIFVMGRYNYYRWGKIWQNLFDSHDLIHNHRKTIKIVVTEEKDGAFAVVEVDTLWRHKESGEDFHWKGRACKVYTKVDKTWKMTMHTGLLDYS